MQRKMKKPIALLLTLLMFVSTVVGSGLFVSVEAAEDDTAKQIGKYYDVDDESGEFSASEPPSLNGNTQQSYANGQVLVNKTISATANENEFEINLEVITKDEIENRTISANAAVVLVIDTSGSMRGSRLTSAKSAAQEFINSFVDENANRQIAIVRFSGDKNDRTDRNEMDGAETVQGWTNASSLVTSNGQQCEAISDLTADGGTNIEAGLILAKNLLKADAVADIENKNIVLLTDGQPTYGVAASEQSTISTTVVCEDGETNMIGDGLTTTHAIHTNVETFMDKLDSGITPYAVYVGTQNVDCTGYNCDVNTTGSQWLSNAGFTAFKADGSAEQLANIFKTISEMIKKQAEAWILTDPMGEMVDFKGFDSKSLVVDEFTYSTTDDQIVWNLRKATPKVGGTATAPRYIYNLSYTVTLDTLNSKFEADTYYPTNGVTSLTYMITTTDSNGAASYSDGVAYCNIPSVKGYVGDLTFNKVDKFGALPGATFTLTTTDDATFSRTADSNGNGVVTFADIPSGHKYTLTETETPTGYVENATKYDVIVSYGSVSTPEITDGEVVNTSETVDITVTKSWEDADDQDGLRPDSISVQLLEDGKAQGDPVKLTAEGEWTYTWEDLPQYKAGKEIVYSVAEAKVNGYEPSYKSDENGFVITNTHTPATVDKTVEKVWNDANDQDGLRPDSVSVQLYANGTAQGNLVTLSDTNNWKYTWEGLDANADGEEIKYTVKETNVPDGYTDTYSEDTFTITNTHVPAVTTYKVTKAWDDDSDRDGLRPDSVSVQLLADGKAQGDPVSVTEAQDGSWTYTWTNLPVNKDGKAIAYTVDELTIVADYTSSVNGSTITNKHNVAVKDVTVEKVWDDADDQDGIRPDSISVQLLANGTAQGGPVELTAENDWTYTWKGLYVNANGEEIVYTVEETNVPDEYESTVDGFVITNSYTPQTTEYTVTKVWADDNNRDGIRPDSVTVQLYADGVEKDDPVSVTAENDWTYTWTNLPVNANGEKIEYTVKEVEVADGYTSSVSGSTITNSHVPEVTERTVTKSWDDDSDRDGIRPDSISVQLLANGEALEDGLVELTAENDWTYTWGNLFVYEDGEEIEYTVEEVNVPDEYESTVDGFTITNSHTPKVTSITANKVWNDANNQDGIRPDSVAVQLYANGEAFGDPVVLNEENGWECTWDDLFVYENGEAIVYTVKEVEVADGYTSSVDGTTITNTHTPATVEKTVEKVWDDNNDAAKKRPDSISVQLYADGEALGEPVVLNNESGWKYTWADLAQYADGKEVVYTVKEIKVPDDYTATYSEDTFTITNTVKVVPDTGDTSNMWIWMTLLCVSGLGLFATALYSKTAKKIKK